jgi:hypothetical protein
MKACISSAEAVGGWSLVAVMQRFYSIVVVPLIGGGAIPPTVYFNNLEAEIAN